MEERFVRETLSGEVACVRGVCVVCVSVQKYGVGVCVLDVCGLFVQHKRSEITCRPEESH